MIKRIILLLIPIATLAGCLKTENTPNCSDVTTAATTSEIASLQAYIDTNHIVATKDARGFFYHLDSVTTGAKPTICNSVNVAYKGYLLDGTIFDQSIGAVFNLSDLIVGWQEAIPLISVGGSMTLYLPPSLAYGSKAVGSIPANSYMKFVIRLVAVN